MSKYFKPEGENQPIETGQEKLKVLPWKLLTTFTGSQLEDCTYEQLLTFEANSASQIESISPGARPFRVLTDSFVTTEGRNSYGMGDLPLGEYVCTAQATIQGKKNQSSCSFVIQDLQLEEQNLQADFELLKNIASTNKGVFEPLGDTKTFVTNISNNKLKSFIKNNEEFVNWQDAPWILLLVVVLLSIEWLLRKYFGAAV